MFLVSLSDFFSLHHHHHHLVDMRKAFFHLFIFPLELIPFRKMTAEKNFLHWDRCALLKENSIHRK